MENVVQGVAPLFNSARPMLSPRPVSISESSIPPEHRSSHQAHAESIKRLNSIVGAVLESLPAAAQLSAGQRRGIIARYSAVLEGNFIYWMTGAYLASNSEEARSIIIDNLREEVRDCHPGMLRKFTLAADAFPDVSDARAVYRNLSDVRLFIGRLAPVPIIAMMAFFEGFIQGFMPYLADLAERQGSAEREYTDVHGVCDIAHSQELHRALAAEMALSPNSSDSMDDLFEGVYLLEALLQSIVFEHTSSAA